MPDTLYEPQTDLSPEVKASLAGWGLDGRCHAGLKPYAKHLTPSLINDFLGNAHFGQDVQGGAKRDYLLNRLRATVGEYKNNGPVSEKDKEAERLEKLRGEARVMLRRFEQRINRRVVDQDLAGEITKYIETLDDKGRDKARNRVYAYLSYHGGGNETLLGLLLERNPDPLVIDWIAAIAFDDHRNGGDRTLIGALEKEAA